MPPIATTGTVTAAQMRASSVEPERRRRVVLRRRLPDRADPEVVGLGSDGLVVARRRAAEQEPALPGPLGALVRLSEVDAVGAELERCVDIVVDHERRAEPSQAAAARDDVGGRRLQPQLDDGGAGLDRPPGRVDDPRRSRALSRHARPLVERRRVECGQRVVEVDME